MAAFAATVSVGEEGGRGKSENRSLASRKGLDAGNFEVSNAKPRPPPCGGRARSVHIPPQGSRTRTPWIDQSAAAHVSGCQAGRGGRRAPISRGWWFLCSFRGQSQTHHATLSPLPGPAKLERGRDDRRRAVWPSPRVQDWVACVRQPSSVRRGRGRRRPRCRARPRLHCRRRQHAAGLGQLCLRPE